MFTQRTLLKEQCLVWTSSQNTWSLKRMDISEDGRSLVSTRVCMSWVLSFLSPCLTHTHTRVHHWLTHSPDLKESLTLKSCFYTLVCADSMSTQSPPGTLYMQILPCMETHKDYTNTTTTGGRGGRGVTTHSLAKNPQGEIWSLSNSEQIIKLVYEIHRGAGSDTHRQSFGSGGVLPPQL